MAVDDSPLALGFSMPAEWEAHEATWLAWPHNRSDWPGKFQPIPWVFGEMVRHIAPGELVRIIVNDDAHEAKARDVLDRIGVAEERVRFHHWPTNRGWTRDTGPIVVRQGARGGRRAVVNFHFNAWAKYRNWHKDDRLAELAADALKLPVHQPDYEGRPFTLEGGAIDVNGQGTLLTTEECLLDRFQQARNPHLDRAGVEDALRRFLGVRNILWLGAGIAGDDTHGHVDDLCRFVSPDTVVLVREDDPADINHEALRDNRRRLESMRLEDGRPVRVVDLPMPRPLVFEGTRLPASYANFYIANAAVLVPTFNDPADRVALNTLAELFPDRAVVGIHAVDLVWGFGTIHCLTQQLPA